MRHVKVSAWGNLVTFWRADAACEGFDGAQIVDGFLERRALVFVVVSVVRLVEMVEIRVT